MLVVPVVTHHEAPSYLTTVTHDIEKIAYTARQALMLHQRIYLLTENPTFTAL
jgi:hypothetical protein